MLSGSPQLSRTVLISSLLLWGPAALAQARPAWVDPPGQSALPDSAAPFEPEPGASLAATVQPQSPGQVQTGDDLASSAERKTVAEPEAVAPRQAARSPQRTARVIYQLTSREQAARDLAITYLDRWSAPNGLSLALASAFYAPTVMFHGQMRSLPSVLAEKRRIAERWPDRSYHYRPETTQVACETRRAMCTVWSIFDYSATNPGDGRRSRGIGDHELVVSFSGGRPVIVAESSRVLRRGAVSGLVLRTSASADEAGAVEDLVERDDPTSVGATAAAHAGGAPFDACREAIATAARPYGGTRVSLAPAGTAAPRTLGTSLTFDARVEYRTGSRQEVRNSRVTCRLGEDGRVIAIQ
jgi:hypothetical protein